MFVSGENFELSLPNGKKYVVDDSGVSITDRKPVQQNKTGFKEWVEKNKTVISLSIPFILHFFFTGKK